ncbi:MAG TPA: methyltransferase domain-containing protein [Candidatus Cybelea sp.]|nr:methyltransferase domain-containing protein [Candidatus Cybelea sp.]
MEAARRFFGMLVAGRADAKDPRIAEAFATVPREKFLGPGPWLAVAGDGYVKTPNADPVLVYHNTVFALLPEKELNNGEPSLHARWMAAIAPKPGERVLHIGIGGGYYTAILAELVGPAGSVIAREIEPEMIAAATRNLADRANVTVVGRSGLEAPLPESDIIYVCAGVTRPVRAWLDALAPGGRLMLPLAPGWDRGGSFLITRGDQGFAVKFVSQVWIISCTGAQVPREADALRDAVKRGGEDAVKSLRLSPDQPDASCWLAGDDWWLSTLEL